MSVYEAYARRLCDTFGLRESRAIECPAAVRGRCRFSSDCLCQVALFDHRRVWLHGRRRRYFTAEPYDLHVRLAELEEATQRCATAGLALDVHWGQSYWSTGTTLIVVRHPDAPRLVANP